MQLSDEGYIIKVLKYGENSLILTVLSQTRGKITGFVKGGVSKKKLGVFQPGNKISFNAYARLDENMPQLKGVELLRSNVVQLLGNPEKLAVLRAFCALFDATLVENEPLEGLWQNLLRFLDNMADQAWLENYSLLEFRLLYFLGVGLDLGTCAVTGCIDNLAFVSPKSGKAVSYEAGLAYKDRLFQYPHFALNRNIKPTFEDVCNLLNMNAFFLKKNFFDAHDLQFPLSRANLQEILNNKKEHNA